MNDYVNLAGGLLLLAVGGELLVRGAVAVAHRAGLSPLLIGLTLVGLGTSAPELVASIEAARVGSPGIAVGNIVGSNIANILLVLGLAALIRPIAVGSGSLKRDGAIVLGVALAFAATSYLWRLDHLVGLCFLAALAAYLVLAYRQERTSAAGDHTAAFEKAEAYDELHVGPLDHAPQSRGRAERLGPLLPVVMAIAGLLILVLGGRLLVDGAVAIARTYGTPEAVIGLTIVAIGTSAPEFFASLVAALRGHSDVALGNVMGSNIYNVLGIGGILALLSPTAVPTQIVHFDNLVMVAASLALLLFARTGYRIGRTEGALLLGGYAVYLWTLWPAA